jgi:hypothetical protein
MRQVIIENLFVNSPYNESRRRFKFIYEGISDMVVKYGHMNQYFLPNGGHKFRLGVHSISR